MDFIITKSVELGITNFRPVITKNTIVNKINNIKFTANVKEASEQSGRMDLAIVENITTLDTLIRGLSNNEIVILCNESGEGLKASKVLSSIKFDRQVNNLIILVGPEGGFSSEEFLRFNKIKNLHSINLGPRILRADTAIISSITLVQEFLGDFNLKCT